MNGSEINMIYKVSIIKKVGRLLVKKFVFSILSVIVSGMIFVVVVVKYVSVLILERFVV